MDKVYVAIDLKSFYASVECAYRDMDPLNTNLVVADMSRTEKTICLAVSPSLKSFGISGRARLFEVIQRVKEVNSDRRCNAPDMELKGKSCLYSELMADPSLELDYIVAQPQMAKYMQVSSQIYGIYLKYVSPDDIFAYSVDEVFIDVTGYLGIYKMSAHDFTRMLIQDVLDNTCITATAGIGTNMYLCKIAMDIVAKHIPADKDGVRIAELDEESYKDTLWSHTPITDFWRVGAQFGKNTELLIDHAWGVEPTTIADVKAYKPENNSITSGQVLQNPTDYEHTKLIVWEMADMLSLDLVDKGLVTDQIVLTIGYDRESLALGTYNGEIVADWYGRAVPKHAHGTINLDKHTASTRKMIDAAMALFERIIDRSLLSRRITLVACNVVREENIPESDGIEQLTLFNMEREQNYDEAAEKASQKEKALQEAMLKIKHKYGKNSVLKGKNFTEGATAKDRNRQIGGHKA